LYPWARSIKDSENSSRSGEEKESNNDKIPSVSGMVFLMLSILFLIVVGAAEIFARYSSM